MNKLKTLLNGLTGNCDWVGLRQFTNRTDYRSARNGQCDQNHTSLNKGIMVEVLNNGQFGYAATSNLTQQGVQLAFDKALDLANLCSAHKITHFDESLRPPEKGSYQSHFETPIDDISPAEIQKRLIELSATLKSHDEIIETQARAMLTQTQIDFVSSNGSQWAQSFQIVSRDLSATASLNDIIQKRSLGHQAWQCGSEALDLDTLKTNAIRIADQARQLLRAPDCPKDTRDLILAPDQLYLQVHESIGHPLELDRILGDERNYAGWSFVNTDDFGKLRYGPDILNVTFDPAMPGEMASYNYDDNGVKAEKEFLIKDGILQRAIGGIESQKRSNIAGVSCGRSPSWNRPPMDRMANINIEAGDTALKDMIRSTEKGILMHTNRSWSIDDYRNKFQFGCEYGELIEDGEIKGIVRNPNYRGSTINFWGNLDMVGDKDSLEIWGSPYCGKGEPNQIIRVGHAVPYCKFKNIDIFGGN